MTRVGIRRKVERNVGFARSSFGSSIEKIEMVIVDREVVGVVGCGSSEKGRKTKSRGFGSKVDTLVVLMPYQDEVIAGRWMS